MIFDLIKAYRQAFRMYVRSITRPKTMEEAEEKRLFWAKMYAASGFLTFTYCIYLTYKENINFAYRKDIPKDLAVASALVKGNNKVTVYEGFTKVRELDLATLKLDEPKS